MPAWPPPTGTARGGVWPVGHAWCWPAACSARPTPPLASGSTERGIGGDRPLKLIGLSCRGGGFPRPAAHRPPILPPLYAGAPARPKRRNQPPACAHPDEVAV